MQITEAEKNVIFMLRTRKAYEVVTIRFDRNGKPDFYLVDVQQKLLITDEGIKEVSCLRDTH